MPNEFDTFRETPPRDIRELFRRLDVCEGIPFGALITAEERTKFDELQSVGALLYLRGLGHAFCAAATAAQRVHPEDDGILCDWRRIQYLLYL